MAEANAENSQLDISNLSNLIRNGINGEKNSLIFDKEETVIRRILEQIVDKKTAFQSDAAINLILKSGPEFLLTGDGGRLKKQLNDFKDAAKKENQSFLSRSNITQEERQLLYFLDKSKIKKDEKRSLVLDAMVCMAKAASLLDQQEEPVEEGICQAYHISHPCTYQYMRFLLEYFMGLEFDKYSKTKKQYTAYLLQTHPGEELPEKLEDLRELASKTVVSEMLGEATPMLSVVDLARDKSTAFTKVVSSGGIDKSMHEYARTNWATQDFVGVLEECRLAELQPDEALEEKTKALEAMIEKLTGGAATIAEGSGSAAKSSAELTINIVPDIPLMVPTVPVDAATTANEETIVEGEASSEDPMDYQMEPNAPAAPPKNETAIEEGSKRKAIEDPAEEYQTAKKRKINNGSSVREPASTEDEELAGFDTARGSQSDTTGIQDTTFSTARGEDTAMVDDSNFRATGGELVGPQSDNQDTTFSTARREESADTADSNLGATGAAPGGSQSDTQEHYYTARGEESTDTAMVADSNTGTGTSGATVTEGGASISALASALPTALELLTTVLTANENNCTLPPQQASRIRDTVKELKQACSSAGIGLSDGADRSSNKEAPEEQIPPAAGTSAVDANAKTVRAGNTSSDPTSLSSSTATDSDAGRVTAAVGVLKGVLEELDGCEFVTKENCGYGSADGGLTITNQGLMYSIYDRLQKGEFPRELESYIKDHLSFETNYPQPTTKIQRNLAGVELNELLFSIVKKLGGGSFGTVLQVFQKTDNSVRLALKVASFDAADFMKYGRREIVQASRIKSRHAIRYLGFFPLSSVSHDDKPIAFGILMEECEHDLEPVIEKLNPKKNGNEVMDPSAYKKKVQRVCQILLQVLAGVRDIAAAGLSHRDIKPGNIGLGKDGYWKLFDFGLARELAAVADMTVEAGTPHWIPPGGRGKNHDVYSLAVLLYHMLTGDYPNKKMFRNKLTKTKDKDSVSKLFGFEKHFKKEEEKTIGDELVDLYAKMIDPEDEDRISASEALPILDGIVGCLKKEFV